MKSVILDLQSTSGTEAPYVMLSRATSLAGVYILCTFQKKVIQRHPSQDVREEFRRLDMLTHQTIMGYGTSEEASAAQKYLVETFSSQALPDPDNCVEDNTAEDNARRLASLQNANSRLVTGTSRAVESDHTRGSSASPRRARITKTSTYDMDGNTSSSLQSKKHHSNPGDSPSSTTKQRRISRI
ncbi:hypothetical protein B0H14DRAFT_3877541 [Mycena olivaceomarginata]|nr:hypothetical protein B0H14DRAFT_3877541 [Mycena olivaceomarginata]